MIHKLNQNLIRAQANIDYLYEAAKKLEELNEQVVYIGGAIIGFFITDITMPDARPTEDVDCVVNVITYQNYHKFTSAIRKKGFKNDLETGVIVRFRLDNITLDVMPADPKILKFGNRWYKEAIISPLKYTTTDDIVIKYISAPYLLATKIDAFRERGNNDYVVSKDIEDIITVIAGCNEIVNELTKSNHRPLQFIQQFLKEALSNEAFHHALPGHVSDGRLTEARVQKVRSKIHQIININS